MTKSLHLWRGPPVRPELARSRDFLWTSLAEFLRNLTVEGIDLDISRSHMYYWFCNERFAEKLIS